MGYQKEKSFWVIYDPCFIYCSLCRCERLQKYKAKKSEKLSTKQSLCFELDELVDLAVDHIDSLHGFILELEETLILTLQVLDLFELGVELNMIGVQDSRLEG